ncbi:hypothetical protein VTJ04DRAFT_10661 [Mycothermus thermophilus]|uniref:uncharacterized protein n=1 Tax=Humicola insolens TaxID=85995 RepID=UPI003743E32B
MAESDVAVVAYPPSSAVEDEEQFWDGLNKTLSATCTSPEQLDETLRSWLGLVAAARDTPLLESEDDVARCSEMLIESPVFQNNRDYVRTQLIYSLLQEDEFAPLHVIANFLLVDGRIEEETFRTMIQEGCFLRLLDLIKSCGDEDPRLHLLLLQLMYEMARIEHLRPEDLLQVDDNFVMYLFRLIEALSDDASDPYHYVVIRVLLVLNEQYMVAATSAAVDPSAPSIPVTNRVVKVLSVHGSSFRTFGENIILLLNRETETSQQLLILKLLYLLFTTAATYEYFYLNDLHVLLDVIIRNLLDLPSEANMLRHTYLRVLAPLLCHTQLSQPPHYKRDQILSLLEVLRGTGNAHFLPPEPTTLRLLERVAKTPWLADSMSDGSDGSSGSSSPETTSPVDKSLTDSQTGSSVSLVANVTEKPGVQTPSLLRSSTVDEGKQPRPGAKGGSPPRPPPPRLLKSKTLLPEVPRHRHGVPIVTAVAAAAFAGVHVNTDNATTTTTTTSNSNTATTTTTTTTTTIPKKAPPQIPPPRRRAKLLGTAGAGDTRPATAEPLAAAAGSTTTTPVA